MVAQTRLGTILLEEGRSQSWLAMKLAAALGRPFYRQQVSEWCRGVHAPAADTREAIANALGRPESDVFPAHDNGACHPDAPAVTADGREAA